MEVYENYYLINDKKYARVSFIAEYLKNGAGLTAWREKVGYEEADRITKEAAGFGDKVHEVCALSDMGCYQEIERMIRENPELEQYKQLWDDWRARYVEEVIVIEEPVHSDKMGVAGTIDRVLVIRGNKRPSIVDIKTGSLSDTVGIQLAGYKMIWNEKHKLDKVETVKAAHMPRKKPGYFKIVDYTSKDYERLFKQSLKEWKKGEKKC